ncbi:zwei Ig domain protein zig-8 isoform X4 [Octopus sinensis]|uniref:Zwei Ig domain protein zig-8 isoform X4 n=1 Tax=Octopus sinensis TaxID=2607531 RepID=A0A7E6FAG2_9MOLL|nr:zwei Ig domain protein zig-8 isoform X4 [Octopus sinensis]
MELEFQDLPAFAQYEDNAPIPRFNPSPTNVTFRRGETAILHCSIENLGTKTVMWRKASDPHPWTIGTYTYVKDSSVTVTHNEEANEWNLLIKNLEKRHGGVYVCQVSTRDRISRQVLLRITDNPVREKTKPIGIQVSGKSYIEKGDPIKLVCNTTGSEYPPLDLDWFKDGNKINADSAKKIKIDKRHFPHANTLSSVLNITHSKMSDAGEYVCRSSNLEITSIKVHVLNGNVHPESHPSNDEKKPNAGSSNVKRDEHDGSIGENSVEVGNADTPGTSIQGTDGNGCTLLQIHWVEILCTTLLFGILAHQ